MAEVLFFLAAIGAVAGAVGTVSLRNPFYAVLALVCHLLALAALFLLLRAEFVAAAQVVVYAGAVMVLYIFVVAYVGGADEPLTGSTGASLRLASIVFALALFAELTIAVVGTGLSALDDVGPSVEAGFGRPAEVGALFLTKFLVAFEIASLLLLIAAVGAVILARRRAGLADEREISVADAMHQPQVASQAEPGTMIEAAGPPQR
jgi:NADH-quinone oxidoreductase subunit J